MRLVKGLRRRLSMAIALLAAFAVVGGVAVWRASELPAVASSEGKQHLKERLQKGVGSEVRFASAAQPEKVDEAVGTAADFIYLRSGLRMSDETKKLLAKAESDALKGKTKYITVGELTDDLATAVVERLATLTDGEIERAADASSDERGEIRSRADGRWGVLTKKELIQQAKSGRDWSQRGDSALHASLRSMIEGEVNDRVITLSAALPGQFGQAGTQGFTPTQALIVAYSVATDDPLTDSRSDIEQTIVQRRMNARMTREQKQAQRNVSDRPYGPRGFEHPSAPHLFFKNGVDKLLNRSEGGKK